ncbi:MAG: c-type cytochrome, partial [Bacteroidota bacterium]
MDSFVLEDGFGLEVVAAEPLVHDPVAMSFDADGNMWIVEMRGYMPNLEGEGEELPTGGIVKLTDQDKDGKMDHRRLVLDSLVLPRALCLIGEGLLFATPPELWFVPLDENGEAGERQLVDAEYAVGGNVEHQPNGLMRGLDNWIYSAKARFRYRLRNGQWEKEATEFRGQWGITMDDEGRLYFNDNSNQLRGDWTPPGSLLRNPYHNPSVGTGEEIVADQAVYPIHATGINRGYQPHMLSDEGHLCVFTAACGPVIYRGDQFPAAYHGNAFVAEPAGNLLKRNVLQLDQVQVKGYQAYERQEFLASKDELFRPTNLYNGPDGTLYVVDFYRGIIQHKTYLTEYLRDHIRNRQLDQAVGGGRIYRIVHKESPRKTWKPMAGFNNKELVAMLDHPNGWTRDMAQQLLVDRQAKDIIPDLQQLLQNGEPMGQLHALWTLEGLDTLTAATIETAIQSASVPVTCAGIRLMENIRLGPETEHLAGLLSKMNLKEPKVRLQMALSIGQFYPTYPSLETHFSDLALATDEDPLLLDALVSGVGERAESFIVRLPERSENLKNALLAAADAPERLPKQQNRTFLVEEQRILLAGKELYDVHCSGCHHSEGKGIKAIAPPLAGSQWVLGDEERLTLIALHGLQGPVKVNGKTYQPPEVQPIMPGLRDNRKLNNSRIAAILSYIRNAWGNEAEFIEVETVGLLRDATKTRNSCYTEDE